MAGSPLKRARREEREADQLATYETVKRAPLPAQRETPAQYGPDTLADILALAAEGYSLAETAAHLLIDEDTLGQWEKAHIEAQAVLKLARTREKAWWSSRARVAIRDDNNRFPAGAWSHVMRARFPEYDDKAQVNVSIDLGSLVVVRLDGEEPTGSRLAADAKPLIEGECIKLEDGLTVEGSTEARVISTPGSTDDPQ